MSLGDIIRTKLGLSIDLKNINLLEILREAYKQFEDQHKTSFRILPYGTATALGVTGIGLYLASKQEEKQGKDPYDFGPFSKRVIGYLLIAGGFASLYAGVKRDLSQIGKE